MTDLDFIEQGDYPGADAIAALEVKAQPEPERCETCRFWDRMSEDRGDCEYVNRPDVLASVWWIASSEDVGIDIGYVEVEAGLSTRAAFHCKGWQPRPPSPGA